MEQNRAPESESSTSFAQPTYPEPQQPAPYVANSSAVSVSKGVVIGGAVAIGVLLLTVIGLLIALVAGGTDQGEAGASAPAATEPADISDDDDTSVEPEPEPEGERQYSLGDTFTVGNVTMTIHSIEAVDAVETVDGPPITADEGGQLFLMKSTYQNSRNQADLSCGNSDLYLQMVDTKDREIAQYFETYRVPGNPGCNDKLVQDTPHEWNLVFQGASGSTPLGIVVNETDTRPEPVIVMFE